MIFFLQRILYNTFVLRLLGEVVRTFYIQRFFPLISPNGMNQNKDKTQQNAFSETHVFKNNKCHEILSFVIARRQKNVRLPD